MKFESKTSREIITILISNTWEKIDQFPAGLVMPNVPRVKGSVEKLVSKDRKVFVSSWIVGNALTVKMVEDQRDSVDKLLDESGLTEFSSQTYFDCYGWPELKPFIRTIQK